MRVKVLGPVEVWSDRGPVDIGGAKPKALLAALLTQPRQVVATERLIDLIWDDDPPSSAKALVHTYVSRLRRGLEEAGRVRWLVTRSPGYLLDVAREDSDVEYFALLLDEARTAERRGEHDEALARYERARVLWRGPAFGDVDSSFARTAATGLHEERLATDEGLCRCLLAVGHTAEAAAELGRLTAAHPLREEARSLLMRALWELGRQVDALAVYRDGRRHLLEELGVEPGQKLRGMHERILNGDVEPPGVRTAVAVEAPPPNRPPTIPLPSPHNDHAVPHNLPPDIGDFTGREDAVARLVKTGRSGPGQRTAPPTVVISGFGGSGKSALAVHAAHLLRDRFPDGQLFADLRGVERDLGPQEVLGRFLGALGVGAAELPTGLDERVELLRRRIAGRRVLIVLDNARNEQQVRPLLPGDPHCLVIVTSRSRLTGLAGVDSIDLDFLHADTSLAMLGKIIGADRLDSDPDAARSIAALCGGVPLAIRAAAAKLLARPHWPLRALAGRLANERRRLDELDVGGLAIRSSLRLNYDELDEPHRRAFHLLTLLDLPDFGAWLAGPLLDVPPEDAEDVVERLVDLRLLEVVGVDALGRIRYRFHDLVQLFGAEHAVADEPAHEVAEAIERTLATWVAVVEAGARRLPRVTLGLRPRLTLDLKPDDSLVAEVEASPTEWLKAETGAVVRTVERAHELGADQMATTLVTVLLSSPFAARNEFDGWQRTHTAALAVARADGNREAQAIVLVGLGQLYYEKDEFDLALEHFRQALDDAVAVGDRFTEAVAWVGMGTVHRDLADFEVAATHLHTASRLAAEIGADTVVAAAEYGLAAINRDHGDIGAAVRAFERCAELYRALDDTRGEALALRGTSLCHRAWGDADLAADLSARAEELLSAAGDDLGAMYATQSLAKARIRQGRTEGVADLLERCASTGTALGDRFGLALVTRTRGELALAVGEVDRAVELLETAVAQWTELGLPVWRARTQRDLAAAVVESDPDRAEHLWNSAVAAFTVARTREAAELEVSNPRAWLREVRVQHGL